MGDIPGTETVGDLLARNPVWEGEGVPAPKGPALPVLPARHDWQPAFPTPGIYFGMDEDVYHAIEAFSGSGGKNISTSNMDYWANSVLNEDRESKDTQFTALGRAYHCRICEGSDVYERRYAIELDRRDYPDALHTIKDLRAAIAEIGEKPKGATKDAVAAQLLDLAPDAQVWDHMVQRHLKANIGRTMISAAQHRRIEIAARMIGSDPELRKAFTGGYAEVAIFWFDEKTGCPCKAKLDYLKVQAIVDLKSFGNNQGRPISRAIDFAIANDKHYIGVMMYRDAVAAAKRMIAERGPAAIAVNPFTLREQQETITRWCERLAGMSDNPTCLWVYQQTGNAPVTRGRVMTIGTVATVTLGAIHQFRQRYVECTNAYGVDPWLDIAPIEATVDEDIPLYATDI